MRAHTRDLRPDRRGAGLGARPRAPLAGGGGARRACSSTPADSIAHGLGADHRAAAGGLGVPDDARAADELAAVGDGGHGRGRHRRSARAGLANHCMHGKDAVVEEILDWRPYDYVTDRTILDTPTGPVKVLHTIELEPTTTGTTIHMRYGAPKTKREQELMMAHLGPAYGAALESGVPSLVAQLERAAGRASRRRRPGARARRAATGRTAGRACSASVDRLEHSALRLHHREDVAAGVDEPGRP